MIKISVNNPRDKILKMLLEKLGKEVSGEKMSRSIGISRVAIGKHIKYLRGRGFNINAKPGGGYTLDELPNVINESLIRAYCKNDIEMIVIDNVESTNIEAKSWAEHGAPNGAVIIAVTQSAGRGRKARKWQSIEGGIWCSIILRTNIAANEIQPITLAAAMSVSMAVTDNCESAETKIKWPNDVLINGKKMCGILTEFAGDIDSVQYLVVGIGINANFSVNDLEGELLFNATTLKDEGIIINSSKLIADVRGNLLDIMDKWADTKSTKHIIDFYRDNMAYKGEKIHITGAGNDVYGILHDIDNDGAIIIKTTDDIKKIISGEISLRRS